jgi:hypothetical protein
MDTDGQSLSWIDNYTVKPAVGLRVNPWANISDYYFSYGVMGGVSFIDPNRRLGLNLRLNYLYTFLKVKDSTIGDVSPFFNTYLELTYKVFIFNSSNLTVSLGVAKPSPKINPYYGCPYCATHFVTSSIQYQFNNLSFEFRIDTPLGDRYAGWIFYQGYYKVCFGVNYTFPLSKKKEKS